jgi:hypothetical protein
MISFHYVWLLNYGDVECMIKLWLDTCDVGASDDRNLSASRWMFDQRALQEYVLICCQDPLGGMVDKPGK